MTRRVWPRIVRTGWFREVRIKSYGAYVVRALLSARDVLVGIRGKIENEIRGLLNLRHHDRQEARRLCPSCRGNRLR
ncbi:hypothetical protein MPLB_1460019 [Mesorhizobium sp. ORS 3324]|nr:hypothetical protein MPLB_1460019 [Mesorhizobium sp. ORS 3324]